MAFSFRAGTNWCHDFPKLARESGFYFNTHTSRVRVDWNRISSIDTERVIRERDFQTIDSNINHVIDYYLESEYDVKILDPNFVKLFRLAQLAVEYLLYCKQYLDQSVVILKEELKYKIDESVKLKDEVLHLQNSIKELKEKLKEKNKTVEFKADTHGEIHKCPHCPKTFVSASFANAHLVRRHSNLQDVLSSSSPAAHEEYRVETEKLHNEIKTLKERLNQTERVIRNETSKISFNNEDTYQRDDQYQRYQEEIKNLKTLLFTEIRNIKRNESSVNQQEHDVDHENVKELISQQENEIQRLKNQLQEQLNTNNNQVQDKLTKQEDYYKTKMEQMENQHRNDIENLFTQLKKTQDSADLIKLEYEEKVTSLEKQSIDQSKLLTVQSEQLSNITKGIIDNQNKTKEMKNTSRVVKQSTEDSMDSESSQNLKVSIRKKIFNQKQTSNQGYNKLLSNKKFNENQKIKKQEEEIIEKFKISKNDSEKNYQNNKSKKIMNLRKNTNDRNKYSSLDESKSATSTGSESEESNSEEESEDELSESSATRTETTDDEEPLETNEKLTKNNNRDERRLSNLSLKSVRQEMQMIFDAKLRELGIDPEWLGVPEVTFQQKMETIKHNQNMFLKKYPKYQNIRYKILEELAKRVSTSQKSAKKIESNKKSFLNKAMKNVKSKALKALQDFKVPKSNDVTTPILSSPKTIAKEFQSKRKPSLELLPKKPSQFDIEEIISEVNKESGQKFKKEDSRSTSKFFKDKEEENEDEEEEIITKKQPKPLQQRSYQTVEEFMRDVDENFKLDVTSTKVTSTPSKNIKNTLLDSYSFTNDSDQSTKQDAMWALASPKNNKSVLKSTTGANNSALVKKKVIFDLEQEKSPKKKIEDLNIKPVEKFDDKKDESDSDWKIISSSEERDKSPEIKTNVENVQLKTTQSERIAEISKKIQEKLETSRRNKPIGSVEAMFSVNNKFSNEEIKSISDEDYKNYGLDYPSSQLEIKSQVQPRPAPRNQVIDTKDLNIDELLATIRQNRNKKF